MVGRGGLPPNADDPLINQGRIVEWASSTDTQSSLEEIETRENNKQEPQDKVVKLQPSISPAIQQAQGLVKTQDGRIFLTANAPMVSPQTGAIAYPYCQSSINNYN